MYVVLPNSPPRALLTTTGIALPATKPVPPILHYSAEEPFTKYEMCLIFAKILGLPHGHIVPDAEPYTVRVLPLFTLGLRSLNSMFRARPPPRARGTVTCTRTRPKISWKATVDLVGTLSKSGGRSTSRATCETIGTADLNTCTTPLNEQSPATLFWVLGLVCATSGLFPGTKPTQRRCGMGGMCWDVLGRVFFDLRSQTSLLPEAWPKPNTSRRCTSRTRRAPAPEFLQESVVGPLAVDHVRAAQV